MNSQKAFSIIDMILGMVVIFALFMYFLPSLKTMSTKPLDGRPSVEEQVDKQIQDVTRLKQQATEQNRKMLEQMNY